MTPTPTGEERRYGKKCAHDGYVQVGCVDCDALEAYLRRLGEVVDNVRRSEVEMLLARVRELEGELKDEKANHAANWALLKNAYKDRDERLLPNLAQAEQRVAGETLRANTYLDKLKELKDLIRRIRDAKEHKGRARERHEKRASAWAVLRDEIDTALAPSPSGALGGPDGE